MPVCRRRAGPSPYRTAAVSGRGRQGAAVFQGRRTRRHRRVDRRLTHTHLPHTRGVFGFLCKTTGNGVASAYPARSPATGDRFHDIRTDHGGGGGGVRYKLRIPGLRRLRAGVAGQEPCGPDAGTGDMIALPVQTEAATTASSLRPSPPRVSCRTQKKMPVCDAGVPVPAVPDDTPIRPVRNGGRAGTGGMPAPLQRPQRQQALHVSKKKQKGGLDVAAVNS